MAAAAVVAATMTGTVAGEGDGAAAIIVDRFIRGYCSTCKRPSAFWKNTAIIWWGFGVWRFICNVENEFV